MTLCYHTFTGGCARRSTNTVWHPTFPAAEMGPKPVCVTHYEPEVFVVNGWLTDLNAQIAFDECEFIDRRENNAAYHRLLVTLAKHGSFIAGRELGQPIDPADQTIYLWNGYGWLVRFDRAVMIGEWGIVQQRYPKMVNGAKIHTSKKTLMSFFE